VVRRHRSARLAAVLFGLLAALILAEGIARWVRQPVLATVVRREAGQGMGLAVPDDRVIAPRIGYRDDLHRIAPPGVRGPPRDVARRADTRRLLLLGDSVAFGQGLPEAEIVSSQLERRLDGWQVWNLAFPGWNTAQEAAALELAGPILQPDVVVVLWVPNDAESLELQRLDADGRVESLYLDERVWLLPGLSEGRQLRLWHRWALWRVLSDAWGAIASPGSLLVAERRYADGIDRIAGAATSLGAEVIWATLPPLEDYPGWDEPPGPGRPAPPHVREPAWRAGVERAEAHGFVHVDLTAAFAPRRPSSLRLRPDDRAHPSAEGHRSIAEALVEPVLATRPR